MCFGGGDGGAGAERARQEAEERERAKAIQRINYTFDRPSARRAREEFGENVYALNREKLDDEQEKRARQRKFQLARQGISGGSQDAFTRGEMAEDYTEALTGIKRHADSRVHDLEAADDRARSNLVGQANSGLDPSSAARLAVNAASSNLGAARSADVYADLGQFMQALSLGANADATRAGQTRGRRLYDEDPYSIFVPGSTGGGSVTSIG